MAQQICQNCEAVVETWQRFCGSCGAVISRAPAGPVETLYFEADSTTGKAKLVVIRGDSTGASYYLTGDEYLAGRTQGTILFPDDAYVSPRHAKFLYRDGKLLVVDAASHNGTYLRIRQPIPLQDGDTFLAGEEVLRFNLYRPAVKGASTDEEYCGTPLRPWRMQITQILEGGFEGIVHPSRRKSLTIGREGCDVNFPLDRYMSGKHVRIEERDGQFMLVDLDSRNGTFYRLTTGSEAALQNGDHVFVGRQLLRVDIV